MTQNNMPTTIRYTFGGFGTAQVGSDQFPISPVMNHCFAASCGFAAPDGDRWEAHIRDCKALRAIAAARAKQANSAPQQGLLNGWMSRRPSGECPFGCGEQLIEGWAHRCNGAPATSTVPDLEMHQLAARLRAAGFVVEKGGVEKGGAQ